VTPRLGYACINTVLEAGTTRTLRLAGIGDAERVRSIVSRNLDDLERILRWNAKHGVRLFRLGSQLIPFASHEAFPYDWRREHGPRLAAIGTLAGRLGQRLSMHPGQYTVPGSPDPAIVARSVAELRYAAHALDLTGTPDPVIVLHVGGAYGDRPASLRRFVAALEREPDVLRWLALENDERTWTVEEIIPVAQRLGVPVIVDNLHHRLNPGRWTLSEAIDRAVATWSRGRRPKLHLSSQDPLKPRGSHAPGIDPADWAELLAALRSARADVMVEAKGKEQALSTLGLSIPAPPPAPGPRQRRRAPRRSPG
jgi:UV DNA damage endonuclease